MARSSRHPREVRERAVTLVLETQADYGSQWEAIVSVAAKVGVSGESLRRWVRQAEVDAGQRASSRPRCRAWRIRDGASVRYWWHSARLELSGPCALSRL